MIQSSLAWLPGARRILLALAASTVVGLSGCAFPAAPGSSDGVSTTRSTTDRDAPAASLSTTPDQGATADSGPSNLGPDSPSRDRDRSSPQPEGAVVGGGQQLTGYEPALGDQPETEPGTDSAITPAGVEPSDQLAADLQAVGTAYLEFDYRVTPAERVAAVAHLMTPELVAALTAPMPPALTEELTMSETVVTAELTTLVALGPGIYELHFDVRTERLADQHADAATDSRLLVLQVDDHSRVGDIR